MSPNTFMCVYVCTHITCIQTVELLHSKCLEPSKFTTETAFTVKVLTCLSGFGQAKNFLAYSSLVGNHQFMSIWEKLSLQKKKSGFLATSF